MIKAVIFDVDGTLVDTVEMHAKAWQRALKEFGKEADFQKVRDQIGKGGDQLMPVFLNEQELKEFGEKLEERRGELYKTEYLSKAQAFPEARRLMEHVVSGNKKIALASSAKSEELDHYKKLLGADDFLTGETTSDDAAQSKPEPDIFEAALKKLGNPKPEETIVIGDTPYDAIAAGKINLRTIGVLSGGFSEESLREAGCVEIYQDPADLLARYDQSILSEDQSKAVRN